MLCVQPQVTQATLIYCSLKEDPGHITEGALGHGACIDRTEGDEVITGRISSSVSMA